jgi:predicted CXXCH cytochrome family protein
MMAVTACAVAAAVRLAAADESVVLSPHNLSTSGRGTVRALHEEQVCIFCHAPHNASPQAPLWNRHNPRTFYRIYDSSTMDARIDQPGGPSKMCLSCHDGSIAMGLVLSRPETDPILLNQPFMPTGPSNLTNDLSDDHPIGFRFDRQLSNRDRQLRSPDLVSERVKLGRRGELECTACHDPHNNQLGNFLRITERQGALCNTCHRMDGWATSSHALSGKFVPGTITAGGQLPFPNMHDAACATCHVSHNAPHRERLLRQRSFDLCIDCHSGVTGRDVSGLLNQRSGHRVNRLLNLHDAAEEPLTMRPHVDCVDCHNPHAARANIAASVRRGFDDQGVPPGMQYVSGVSASGLPRDRARYYYEVCFKCHADNPVPIRGRIIRQRDNLGNVRRELLPTAASAHPVVFPGRGGADVPSLVPAQRTRSFLSCQDCHNNPDARELGGLGPNGPHGSRFAFLLNANYETADFSIESAQAYALCYQCHDRTSILGDESFPFHRVHVVNSQTPCSACHAPHGVSGSSGQHNHLINFDVTIVGGRRQFTDTGRFSGSCTLVCHGVDHVNFTY